MYAHNHLTPPLKSGIIKTTIDTCDLFPSSDELHQDVQQDIKLSHRLDTFEPVIDFENAVGKACGWLHHFTGS